MIFRKKIIKKQELYDTQYFHNSAFHLKIAKSKIPNAGLGIFTLDFIPKDTIIDEYLGKLIETMTPKYNKYYYEIQNIDLDKNITSIGVDAKSLPRCYMAMLNDANFNNLDPNIQNNCEFVDNLEQKKVFIASNRDIEPGEELFVEYGDDYWNYFKNHPEWE